MRRNTVTADGGSEVYINQMYSLADEYIDTLNDQERIYNASGNTFTGMIKYICRNTDFTDRKYTDIHFLDRIWDIYTDLVYKYNQKPTIEEFALLVGISREIIYQWDKGDRRGTIYKDKDGNVIEDFFSWNNSHRGEPYTKETCEERSKIIGKWKEECRLGRYKSAASGNVGGIFLCKAVDGMVETAPVQINDNERKNVSIDEITERYRVQCNAEGHMLEPPKADF